MRELLQLFVDIALSRKGPQDVPASVFLLVITVSCYLLVGFGTSWLLQPIEWWLLFVDLGFVLAWYATLTRLFGKSERFFQTAIAVFGYKIILEPPLVAVITLGGNLGKETPWLFPVGLLFIVLIVWMIRAGSYVLKQALELPLLACISLVVAEFFANQLVLHSLSNPPPTAPT